MEAVFIYFLVIISVIAIVLFIVKTFKEEYFKKYPETFNSKFILSLFLYLILIYFGIFSFIIGMTEKYEKENKACFYIGENSPERITRGEFCSKHLNGIEQEYFLYLSGLIVAIFLVMITFRKIKDPKSIQVLFNEEVDNIKLEDFKKIRPWFLVITIISFLVLAFLIIVWGMNN